MLTYHIYPLSPHLPAVPAFARCPRIYPLSPHLPASPASGIAGISGISGISGIYPHYPHSPTFTNIPINMRVYTPSPALSHTKKYLTVRNCVNLGSGLPKW